MAFFDKAFAFAMLPLSVLIILEELDLFSLSLIFDKALVGAIIMIILQLISLFTLNEMHEHVRTINVITFFFLILPSVLYIVSSFISISFSSSLPLIIGVMMFVESLYAFH